MKPKPLTKKDETQDFSNGVKVICSQDVLAAVEWLKRECDIIDPDAEGKWDRVIDEAFNIKE